MFITTVIEKMIDFSNGNVHDINHFLKVWAFAKTIGEKEEIDSATQEILEVAAIVHDIACPLCREKYGNTNGKHQEEESAPLIDTFFSELSFDNLNIERIKWLVTHHHTYTDVDGLDYQILLEADFLVNANESNYSKTVIENAKQNIFRTSTGIHLLNGMYLENA